MKMTFHIKWVLLYISVLVLTKYKNDNPKLVVKKATKDMLPQKCFSWKKWEQPTNCRRRGLECRVYNTDRCKNDMVTSELLESNSEPLYSAQCPGKKQKYCLQYQGKCQWVESAFRPLCGSVPITVMDSSNRNYPVFYCYFIVLFLYCYSYYYTRSRLSAGLKEKCDEKEIKGAYEARTISPDYEHIAGTKGLSWTDTYFDRDDSVIAVFDMDTSLYKSEVLQGIQFLSNLIFLLSIFFILVVFFVDVVDDGTPLSLEDMFSIYFVVLFCHVIASVCRKLQMRNPKMHTAVTTEGVVVLRKGVSSDERIVREGDSVVDLIAYLFYTYTRSSATQTHTS